MNSLPVLGPVYTAFKKESKVVLQNDWVGKAGEAFRTY